MIAPALLLAAAAAGLSGDTDLASRYDHGRRQLCELRLGAARSAIGLPLRPFAVFPEGLRELRYRVRLCHGRVSSVLAFDERDRLEQIMLNGGGTCLGGLCIGQPYRAVRRRGHGLRVFLTSAEGGFFALEAPGQGVTYAFEPGRIDLRCFEALSACPRQWDETRIAAININPQRGD